MHLGYMVLAPRSSIKYKIPL